LHLDQTAERTVPRDRLTIEIRAEATGTDPSRVQAEVNRRMAAALAKVKAVAVVKAASGNYQTYRTTPDGPDGKPKPPAQWQVTQELNLTSGDFKAALDLAGRLQADGLLLGDMRFDVAPETLRAQQRALTDEALTELRTRAGQIAAALGLKVAQIQNLRVGNATQPGGRPRPMMMARMAATAAPPPAVEAGATTVSVAVDADIALASPP
jgi:predicted secreted protein